MKTSSNILIAIVLVISLNIINIGSKELNEFKEVKSVDLIMKYEEEF